MFSQYKGTCPYLTLIIVPTNPKVNAIEFLFAKDAKDKSDCWQ